MAAPSMALAANVTDAMIEKVRTKVQELFETSDTVAAMIRKSGEVEKISDKLYRIPLVKYRGGITSVFDADGGDMGSGTGMKVIKVTGGYKYTRSTWEISKRAMDTTDSAEKSTINILAYTLKNAIRECQKQDDIHFHTNGSGILTDYASATSTWTSSKTTYTFGKTGDGVGVSRLAPGMAVVSADYDGSAANTEAPDPLVIDHIDWTNKVVYLDGIVSGAVGSATGDILVVPGMTATFQSFQSTWPLSGDTFRHGLYYAMDNTTSNYYLGLLKSDETELLPNYVNAGGTDEISFASVQALLDQITNRRDESMYSGLVGLFHPAQRAAIFNKGYAQGTWLRKGGEKSPDLGMANNAYSDGFDVCGIPCRTDKRQSKNRVDFIIPKLWGRAMLHDLKFHEVGGKTIFESRAATGNLKAAQHFHLVSAFDYVSFDPGSQGYIYGLVVPSGY